MLEHSIDIQLKHPDDSFSLFGSNERHLRLMEQELGVVIHARTEKVQVIGQEEHVEQARLVIQSLLVLVSRGLVINTPDVVTAISMAKNDEIEKQKLGWDIKRTLVKMNYHIHTDAIKNNLIPPNIAKNKIHFIYASEADLLNIALFGKTAKQWSEQNPKLEGNMRDYSTAEQLVVLANLESLNAQFIKDGLEAEDRLLKLNNIAIEQLQLLLNYSVKKIEKI